VFVAQGTDVVEVYDPVNDTWSKKASLPISTGSLTACVINSQLFVITWDGQTYMYDPYVDSWSSKASIPANIIYTTAHVINDQIFVITQSYETPWEMYMYNPTTDSWTKKANPSTSDNNVFVVVDNKIIMCSHLITYLTPMYTESAVPLNLRIYDPETDTWSEIKTGLKSMCFCGLFVGVTSGVYAPKNVYVFGGEQIDRDTYQTFTWVYDPIGDTWSTAKPMSMETLNSGLRNIIVVDDVFYVINEYGTVVEQYVPVGYDGPLGYQTPPDATTPSVSLVPSESEHSGAFLTGSVVDVIVLTAGVVVATSLFFYLLRGRKRSKSDKYEKL